MPLIKIGPFLQRILERLPCNILHSYSHGVGTIERQGTHNNNGNVKLASNRMLNPGIRLSLFHIDIAKLSNSGIRNIFHHLELIQILNIKLEPNAVSVNLEAPRCLSIAA